ncbi:hypothetical protein SSX86_015752 [Deinandra increscens subsp. villosa]|uniref:Zinc finger PHD-type domain-containing protein n=1 Tax=Deinandra increscens subsp. villosa TaxID=3103831 RepID=A0AAP0D1D7_9ASTR
MEGHEHFSHKHKLSFHKSFEGAKLTCNGCNFPCTGTPVYSCRPCKFFLHERCFKATRSLIHPSHPDHPLSLSPYSTYTSGYFRCNSCHEAGSGFCFCCSACQFDLHINCAYDDLNPKPTLNPTPNQIKLKSHPNHLLTKHRQVYCTHFCNVCSSVSDPGSEVYRCHICDYDVHVGCTSLPETIRGEGHEHTLSLLYVNPHPTFECDVCKGTIAQKNCMYMCISGCSYGMHVKCTPIQIKLESHPSHALIKHRLVRTHECDVCGTACVSGSEVYRCDICDYDAHVGCTVLPETVHRKDHEHTLSLLYVNPHPVAKCDVCSGAIAQTKCMYLCTSGCNYGTHVKCVAAKVPEKEQLDEKTFQLEMLKLQDIMKEHQMAVDTMVSSSQGFHCNR